MCLRLQPCSSYSHLVQGLGVDAIGVEVVWVLFSFMDVCVCARYSVRGLGIVRSRGREGERELGERELEFEDSPSPLPSDQSHPMVCACVR